MKNNKIINSRRTTRHRQTWKTLFWEKEKNGWQHYVYQTDECALHGS